MRVTINMDDDVHALTKVHALDEKRTLGEVIESAPELYLSSGGTDVQAGSLPVSRRTGGARTGVDLSSNRSMLEAMSD